jgi:hypothetical protein
MGLESRIERVRQSMLAQQARLSRASMLTASIGAILCALMAFYFYYGYVRIQEVMTPQAIVQAAESLVLDSIPQARVAMEKQINESADDWAADVSEQVQANMPKVREKLEDFLVAKSAEAIDEFQVMSATQFRTFVNSNQPMLADGFRSLKKQEEADRFVQDLHSVVEKELATDMRSQAEDMLHVLIDLNAKLAVLAKGERMNHEQALEREILMIARRLQLETHANKPEDPQDSAAARRARKAAQDSIESAASGAATDKSTESDPPVSGSDGSGTNTQTANN